MLCNLAYLYRQMQLQILAEDCRHKFHWLGFKENRGNHSEYTCQNGWKCRDWLESLPRNQRHSSSLHWQGVLQSNWDRLLSYSYMHSWAWTCLRIRSMWSTDEILNWHKKHIYWLGWLDLDNIMVDRYCSISPWSSMESCCHTKTKNQLSYSNKKRWSRLSCSWSWRNSKYYSLGKNWRLYLNQWKRIA